jgi:hypothetical protein
MGRGILAENGVVLGARQYQSSGSVKGVRRVLREARCDETRDVSGLVTVQGQDSSFGPNTRYPLSSMEIIYTAHAQTLDSSAVERRGLILLSVVIEKFGVLADKRRNSIFLPV